MKIMILMAAVGTALLATACVVVPVGPDGRPVAGYGGYGSYPTYPAGSTLAVTPLVPPVPSMAVMNARLYPANEQAQASGMAVGQVTNFLDGKGAFTVTIGGEQFSGEATRAGRSGGSAREGIANAMGSRGGTMSCNYVSTMRRKARGNVRSTAARAISCTWEVELEPAQFDRFVDASSLAFFADRLAPDGKQIRLGDLFETNAAVDGFGLLVADVTPDGRAIGERGVGVAHHDFGDAAALA